MLAQVPVSSPRGLVAAHDPSTLIKCNNRYYQFWTGRGILSKSSADRILWSPGPAVFTNPPAWTTNAVPGFRGTFWAPDVIYFGGQYHLYYSVSTFGSQVSAIGLVTNPTLDPSDPAYHWADQGPVIQSTNGLPYNTIDPALAWDAGGNLWMVFGSYWTGIYLVQLDAATGLRLSPGSPTYRLAYNSSIEASYIYRHAGYYYLFVNWGSCCSGVNSTYNIRVGRSTSITGPYLDRNGVDMVNNGGSLFLRGTGKYTGPGHVAIYNEAGVDWLTYHYYDANAWSAGYHSYGAASFDCVPLSWTADGWPAFTNDWSALYEFAADARDTRGKYSGLLQNGASIQADPVHGPVLNLDGLDQYVWLPPGLGYAQTFVAVVNWRGGGAWQRIFDFGFDTSKTVMLTPSSGDNVLRCDINPGGNLQTLQWTNPLPQNTWTHVAVTLDGTRGVLYVNGAPVATNASMNLLPLNVAPQTNHLGRSKFSADPYFNGQFAAFRVYGRALSAAEIVAPLPIIDAPAQGFTYQPGATIRFSGRATDFADVGLNASALIWTVEFRSASVTNIVLGPLSGVTNASFTVPGSGQLATNGFYHISLQATDSAGRKATNAVDVFPGIASSSPWSSYYPFNNGAQDASNHFNGTLLGGASIMQDAARAAVLNLAGSGQYVSLPVGTADAQTISGWVKWSGGAAWQRIFDFGVDTQEWFFLTPFDSQGLAQCALTTSSSDYVQVIESSAAFPVNTWTHVAVALNGIEGTLFINGQAVAINNSVNLLPSDIPATGCWLGRSHYAADPYFSGRLDSFKLNSQALSLAEILAPTAVINQPAPGALFAGGASIPFSGIGYDYSEAPLPSSALVWSADAITDGEQRPAFGPVAGVTNGTFQIPSVAPLTTNHFYHVRLQATDAAGRQSVATADVMPRISVLSMDSVPEGFQLGVDGLILPTPATLPLIAGYTRTLQAFSPQFFAGKNYSFVLWSDGGPATHSFSVPGIDTNLTASFVEPEIQYSFAPGSSNLDLAWPSWAAPLTLCTASNLTPPIAWIPVTNTPLLLSGRLTLSLGRDRPQAFYRLQSQ